MMRDPHTLGAPPHNAFVTAELRPTGRISYSYRAGCTPKPPRIFSFLCSSLAPPHFLFSLYRSNMDVMRTMMPATAPSPQLPDMVVFFARNQLYAKQVWWFIASFIGLVAVCQLLSWIGSKVFSTAVPMRQTDPEGPRTVRRREPDWSRLPVALVNYFRVLAFRHTVDVGTFLNITAAEAFITVGYIVALFTWDFINSTFVSSFTFGVTMIDTAISSDESGR